MKNKFTYLIVLIILFLVSCQQNKEYIDKMNFAESLLESYPDSALSVLNSVPISLLIEDDANRYLLIRIQAKDKSAITIAEDTTIFSLKDKYIKRHPEQASIIHFYSGKVLEQQSNKADAMLHYLEAERLVDGKNYKLNGLIKSHIGKLYFTQHNYEYAKENFQCAKHYFKEIEDYNNLIVTYNQIGNCHLLEENTDSAYFYYDQCESLLQYSNDLKDRGALINNLSISYRVSGDMDKANAFLQETLTYPQIEKKDLCRVYMNIAQLNKENRDTFDHYMNKALLLSEEVNMPVLSMSIYSILADHAESKKLYELAIEYNKSKQQAMKDHFDAIYKTSLSDLENKYHNQLLEEANLSLIIRQQRLMIVCFGVVMLFMLSIYYIVKQKHKLQSAINSAAENLDDLQRMAKLYNATEQSLRNVVLKDFNLLKKVALLENYMLNNDTNRKFIKKINEILYEQDTLDWERMYETMNSLHRNLFNKIKEEFPVLNEYEFKVCCLTIAKLSNSEIGIIMNNSGATVQSRKTYIRKKLGIPHQGNIRNFFLDYFQDSASIDL